MKGASDRFRMFFGGRREKGMRSIFQGGADTLEDNMIYIYTYIHIYICIYILGLK